MNVWLAVGLGGCAGALARHGVALLVARLWTTPWPVATFAINVSGSFLLGLFVAWAAAHTDFGPNWRPLIATGFLGAYTTFSTFELEPSAWPKPASRSPPCSTPCSRSSPATSPSCWACTSHDRTKSSPPIELRLAKRFVWGGSTRVGWAAFATSSGSTINHAAPRAPFRN